MEYDIQNEKSELIQWLRSLEDDAMIKRMLIMKNEDTSDWSDTLSEAEKDAIKSGISDADQGKLKPNIEAKRIYGKWL